MGLTRDDVTGSRGARVAGAPEELQRIFRERAAALARAETEDEAVDFVEVMVVRVGAERYAIELRHVDEVRAVERPARLPAASKTWAGLVAVRGALYPVLDLSRFLGVASAGTGFGATVVLVSVGGLSAGLIVDDVPELARIPREYLQGSPSVREGPAAVRGITPDLVSILDLEAAFADPRVQPTEDQPISGGQA